MFSINKIIKLDGDSLLSLSRIYVNKNDALYKNASKIVPIDGYEDFICHGENGKYLVYESTMGENTYYTANEFAEILKTDLEYHGGNIRLLACSAGAGENSIAQNLANILHVKILAPTEDLYVNENGEMFITKYAALAEMWADGLEVKQTGCWKEFYPA